MQNMTCETVTVIGEKGHKLRMNKTDYDTAEPGTYALYNAPADTADDDKPKANGPEAGSGEPEKMLTVTKTGNKHFVTDTEGNAVDDDRFNKAGYKTDAEAWAAIYPSTTA